jgi:hypothetical protein
MAAMNAPRICKLRKNCLTGIDQCAILRNGVIKEVQIDAFMTVKCRMEKKFIPSALRIFTAHI